jgi:hypothetical protein
LHPLSIQNNQVFQSSTLKSHKSSPWKEFDNSSKGRL